jgi:hypothetical protein
MAIALKQAVDPSYLLQRSQWAPQGWGIVRQSVLRAVPGDQNGIPLVSLQVDAYEWDDVNAFGIGNTDDALTRLGNYIRAGGSDLYAYTLFRRTAFNFLGIRVTSYRLVLLHSLVQLLEGAVLIMAIAFAAIIFLQYVTTGHSPALTDLKNAWQGIISSAGQAVGAAGGGLATPFIWATIFAGVAAIGFASAQKSAGVKARIPAGPKGSVGLRTGPVTTRVGS